MVDIRPADKLDKPALVVGPDLLQSPEAAFSLSNETPPDLGDRYELLEFIGAGGMGSVWKVRDKSLGENFAVKVLKPSLLIDENSLKRFQQEARLATELTHANIAATFGTGEDAAGRPYIVMRFVDGESLAELLSREGKIEPERAMEIFRQVCAALAHSHMKGIVHRDIKPGNIILSRTESGAEVVQVIDFGIARSVYAEAATQALTKVVDVLGSLRYMSPEQLLGQEVGPQSDVYSLGCVLYEMLTGSPPFRAENPVKLILQHLGEAPDLSKVPPRLRAIVSECLHKDVAARIVSVDRLGLLETRSSQRGVRAPIEEEAGLFSLMLGLVFTLSIDLNCMDSGRELFGLSSFLVLIMIGLAWSWAFFANCATAATNRLLTQLEFRMFATLIAGIASILAAAIVRPFPPFWLLLLSLSTVIWLMSSKWLFDCYERFRPSLLNGERTLTQQTVKLGFYTLSFLGLYCSWSAVSTIFGFIFLRFYDLHNLTGGFLSYLAVAVVCHAVARKIDSYFERNWFSCVRSAGRRALLQTVVLAVIVAVPVFMFSGSPIADLVVKVIKARY